MELEFDAALGENTLLVGVFYFAHLGDGDGDGVGEFDEERVSVAAGEVPGATSSFYFKGKQIPVADIAKTLGVRYVLDGSVRKSGPMLRVAARLIRADSGYIVWSETYDRPFKDKIWVQDDIASEVTKALRTSIQSMPDRK